MYIHLAELTDGVQRGIGRPPTDFPEYARRTAAPQVSGTRIETMSDLDVPFPRQHAGVVVPTSHGRRADKSLRSVAR